MRSPCQQEPVLRPQAGTGARLLIVGNGLIGSHAGPLAARINGVTHVTLVDRDCYSAANLVSQAIDPSDVGRSKVDVMARRIRQQSPHVTVESWHAWVEQVPLGQLRADVVLSCVDSRRARMSINEVCWRLGMPLVDAGVDGASWLTRTNLYGPGPDQPCLECGWNTDDYSAVEQIYACTPAGAPATATNAAASLGAIAAGHQVALCQRLLSGESTGEMFGRQVLWDCQHARCLETTYRANPDCRFDHAVWAIEPLVCLPASITLDDFSGLVGELVPEFQAIGLAGQPFVRCFVCSGCGAVRDNCLLLERALSPWRLCCRSCHQAMAVSGFHSTNWLALPGDVSRKEMRRTLASIGFLAGDIVSVRTAAGVRHLELVPPTTASSGPSTLGADRRGPGQQGACS